ncbi:MAG: polymer-forming cytoskeletal protein [Candidatus Scalindua sp.]|nr:polymer-forming cytoskeletal protein [Candidatus Scalindua sp.]
MYNLATPVAANIRAKDISCPYCQGLISVPGHCVSFPCRHCKGQIDLSYKRVDPGKDTDPIKHSDFYLEKYHRLEVSRLFVGNAVIGGEFKGHLSSSGTVKILEDGKFCGKISCRRFVIKKGGVFEGTLQLLYNRDLDTLPVKNYNQFVVK